MLLQDHMYYDQVLDSSSFLGVMAPEHLEHVIPAFYHQTLGCDSFLAQAFTRNHISQQAEAVVAKPDVLFEDLYQ